MANRIYVLETLNLFSLRHFYNEFVSSGKFTKLHKLTPNY